MTPPRFDAWQRYRGRQRRGNDGSVCLVNMLQRKPRNVQEVARKSKDAKLAHKYKFGETLRAGPATPCSSFLASHNKVEETYLKGPTSAAGWAKLRETERNGDAIS